MDNEPWPNQPVVSNLSFIQRIFSNFKNRKPVPPQIVDLHNSYLKKLDTKAWHLQRLHLERFENADFIKFINIQRDIQLNVGDYQGLKSAIDKLDVAIIAAKNFLLITETELRFRGKVQQLFYHYVEKILAKAKTHEEVISSNKKLRTHLNKIKTQKGRLVIKHYLEAIDAVSHHPLGLELLKSFKAHKTNHYKTLRVVSDLAKETRKVDLHSLVHLTILVQERRQYFSDLGSILDLPVQLDQPIVYARMLLYLGLKHRHSKSEREFKELIRRLRDWKQPYSIIINLRQEYTDLTEYKIPKTFKAPLPGAAIYEKYKNYLYNFTSGPAIARPRLQAAANNEPTTALQN